MNPDIKIIIIIIRDQLSLNSVWLHEANPAYIHISSRILFPVDY